ncbi:hypothetical protein [Streptomyces sp. NPDC058307]|uniref:hypothetical protein n=1 Tax=Streptomyces sp. NPDC058307 TaxID=3346439 RepID=UPI0036EBC9A4
MAFFDEAAHKRGRKKTFERLERYRGLRKSDNPSLHTAFNNYFDQLKQEGRWINQGHTPNENWTNREVVDNLVKELQKSKAFAVRGNWWLRHQNDHLRTSSFQAELTKAAKRHTAHVGAWSKLTGLPAESRADAQDGVTLEGSPAAAVVDAIPDGFPRSAPSPTMGYAWGTLSATFMGQAHGHVDADIFEAVDPNSVLAKIEIKELEKLIDQNKVDGVTIHVRERDAETSILKEVQTFTVHSQASFDALPTVSERYQSPEEMNDFRQRQNREYITQQVGRAIIRNRQGLQTSLDGFESFIHPDRLVFVTPKGEELPQMSASRDQIAALQDYKPLQKLHQRLYSISQQQGTGSMSSASTSSAPVQGLHSMDSISSRGSGLVPVNTTASAGLYATNTNTGHLPTGGQQLYYSTTDTRPAPVFTDPNWVLNRTTTNMSRMTIAPDDTNHYTRSGDTASTTPASTYTRPLASLTNPTGSYYGSTSSANPVGYGGYGGYGSQGSTDSASSDFGAPLARTDAHEGHTPPPASPATDHSATHRAMQRR